MKQETLRMAPQLRNSDKWGGIYITPDLSRAVREAARKLREELASRHRAGEINLAIQKGKIVSTDNDPPQLRHRVPKAQGTGSESSTVNIPQAAPQA